MNNATIASWERNYNRKIRKIEPTEAYIEEAENGKDILIFSDGDEELEKKTKIEVKYNAREGLDVWRQTKLYTIEGIETTHDDAGTYRTYYCESAIYQLYNVYIDDIRFYNSSARQVFDAIFEYSELDYRFEDENLGSLPISTNFYHMDAYTAFISSMNKLGLKYKFSTNFTGRFKTTIIIYKDKTVNPDRIAYGKNLLSAVRRVKEDTIVNVIYPYGNGQEILDEEGNGTGNYGRKIDISTAEKGDGSKAIRDDASIERWGRHEAVMDFDCDDVDELYELAFANLQELKNPRVEYEVEVAPLDHFNYKVNHEVIINDPTINLIVKATVKETKYNLLTNELSLKLGDYSDLTIKNKKDETAAILQKVRDRVNELAANFTPTEGGGEIISVYNVEGLSEILDRLELKINENAETYITKSEITVLRNEINAKLDQVGGFVYLDEGKGILTYNSPREQNPSSVVWINGGSVRIANSKDSNGNWIFKTAITGDGINAEAIQANQLTTDLLKYGDVVLTKELQNLNKKHTETNNYITQEFSRVSTAIEDRFNSSIEINEEKVLDLETRIRAGEVVISGTEYLARDVETAKKQAGNLLYNGSLRIPQAEAQKKLVTSGDATFEYVDDIEKGRLLKITKASAGSVNISVPFLDEDLKYNTGEHYTISYAGYSPTPGLNSSVWYGYGMPGRGMSDTLTNNFKSYSGLILISIQSEEGLPSSGASDFSIIFPSAGIVYIGDFRLVKGDDSNNVRALMTTFTSELNHKLLTFTEKIETDTGRTIEAYKSELSARLLEFEDNLNGYSSRLSAAELEFKNTSNSQKSRLDAIELAFKDADAGLSSRLSAMDLKFTNANNGLSSSLDAMSLDFNSKINKANSSLSALSLKFDNAESERDTFESSMNAKMLNLTTKTNGLTTDVTNIQAGMAEFIKARDVGPYGTTSIDGGRIRTGAITSVDKLTRIDLTGGKLDLFTQSEGIKLDNSDVKFYWGLNLVDKGTYYQATGKTTNITQLVGDIDILYSRIAAIDAALKDMFIYVYDGTLEYNNRYAPGDMQSRRTPAGATFPIIK